MYHRSLTIASRNSPLAMWQTHFVKDQLQKNHKGLIIDIKGILTQGDKMLATPLNKIGGKGLFVKELEKAIFERQADIAVHSIKDMPMDLPKSLTLACICEREDPRDAFVSNKYTSLSDLPNNSIVGTSSLRRQAQIKALFPKLIVIPLRGNVGTRLRKLDEGEYDAIILAAIGLERLQMKNRITEYLPTYKMLPAAGQGAIGVECREDDEELIQLLAPLDHSDTRSCILAERRIVKNLGGSCQVPIGAYAIIENNQLKLKAMVGEPDGSHIIYAEQAGAIENALSLGDIVSELLIKQGADKIIQRLL